MPMTSYPTESSAAASHGWVLMPAYREREVIGHTVGELVSAGYKVLVVDDGSGDGTAELAREAGATVLRHKVNLEQGAALETGMAWLRLRQADWAIHFDSDGQHDVADIPRMLAALAQCEVALGSRFLEGGEALNLPPGRRVVLKLATIFHGLTTGLWLTYAHCGIRALSGKALQAIRLREPGMAHATEILSEIRHHKLSCKEVPVRIRYTEYSLQKGQSNSQAWGILKALIARRLF